MKAKTALLALLLAPALIALQGCVLAIGDDDHKARAGYCDDICCYDCDRHGCYETCCGRNCDDHDRYCPSSRSGTCSKDGSCKDSGSQCTSRPDGSNGSCGSTEPTTKPATRCYSDRNCEKNERCVEGKCQPTSGGSGTKPPPDQPLPPGTCRTNDDCDKGQECSSGKCAAPCRKSCQCPTGQACDNGYCKTPPPAAAPKACTDICDCPSGQQCVDGFCK